MKHVTYLHKTWTSRLDVWWLIGVFRSMLQFHFAIMNLAGMWSDAMSTYHVRIAMSQILKGSIFVAKEYATDPAVVGNVALWVTPRCFAGTFQHYLLCTSTVCTRFHVHGSAHHFLYSCRSYGKCLNVSWWYGVLLVKLVCWSYLKRKLSD